MSHDSHRQLDRIRRRVATRTHSARAPSLALPLILAIAKSTLVQADLSSGPPSVRVRQSPVMSVGHPAGPARLLGMAAFRSLSSLFGMISLFCAPSSTDAPPGSVARARPLALASNHRRRHNAAGCQPDARAHGPSMPYSCAICLGRLSYLTAFLCLYLVVVLLLLHRLLPYLTELQLPTTRSIAVQHSLAQYRLSRSRAS